MKVKTLKDDVGTLNKKGTILEVPEKQAKKWIELGAVEKVTEKKTSQKKTSKKGKQGGEK